MCICLYIYVCIYIDIIYIYTSDTFDVYIYIYIYICNKSPSTDSIIEGLEICLKYNNIRFGSQNLVQLNGIVTGAPNSRLYADLAVFDIDKNV